MDEDKKVLSKIALFKTAVQALEVEDFKLPSDMLGKLTDIADDVELISSSLSNANSESKDRKLKLRDQQMELDKVSKELEEVTGKFTTLEQANTELDEKLKSSDEKLTGYHSQRKTEFKALVEQGNILEKENILKYLTGDLKKIDDMSSDDIETNMSELNKMKDLGVLDIKSPPSSQHSLKPIENNKASSLVSLYDKK